MTSDASQHPAPAIGAFEPRTPWPAWAAAVATLLIVLSAILVGFAASMGYFALVRGPGGEFGPERVTLANTMGGMVIMQLTLIGLVWWLSGWFGGVRAHVLSLVRLPTWRMFAIAVAAMVAILAPYNLVTYTLWPTHFTTDLRSFSELARSDAAWIAAIVVAIGAPLSEELLFRGFLLPALTQSRLGFWGAALFSTLAWTAMHWGYTAMGMVEVFVVGLYFCWLMWRFGSLWLTIGLHAFYNALQFALLTQITLPQPA